MHPTPQKPVALAQGIFDFARPTALARHFTIEQYRTAAV